MKAVVRILCLCVAFMFVSGSVLAEEPDLTEGLRLYREDRETMMSVSNGLIFVGAPNGEDYGLDFSAGMEAQQQFDAREKAEAGAAAEAYIAETLGIVPPTVMSFYMCVDPEILNIYLDTDKGVASGYSNDNIYVVEFCNDENWEYIFLVREGKGSAWKVIHSGSSYKEDAQ